MGLQRVRHDWVINTLLLRSEFWSPGGRGLRFSAWGHCSSVRHTEETMTFTVLCGHEAGQINLCDLRTICFLKVGEISLRNHLGAFLGGTSGNLGVAFLCQFYYNSRIIISLFRFSMSPRFSFYKLYFFRTVSLYFIHAFKCICREAWEDMGGFWAMALIWHLRETICLMQRTETEAERMARRQSASTREGDDGGRDLRGCNHGGDLAMPKILSELQQGTGIC